jgi:hypothetical protein
MSRRVYVVHRGAYTPRRWPQLAVGAVVGAPLALLWDWLLPDVLAILMTAWSCLIVAITVVTVTWEIWERRHPLRPCGPHCYLNLRDDQRLLDFIDHQREVAPWQ